MNKPDEREYYKPRMAFGRCWVNGFSSGDPLLEDEIRTWNYYREGFRGS